MKVLAFLAFISLSASSFGYYHYPEDRTYDGSDQGYTQYGAPSLAKTGKYALTFDDGPHPIKTPKVLDTLKKYNAKAVFFVVTSQISEGTFPLIKRMLDEGHIVASHGRFHDNSDKIPKAEWKSKVKQSFVDLARWYKRAGHSLNKLYYRFPYAVYGGRSDHHHMNTLRDISLELTGKNCIHFVFWDHDTGDWIPKMTGDEVSNNFKATNEGGAFITYKTVRVNGKLTQVKVNSRINDPMSGGVVLQHDIQDSTVNGTEKILRYAEAKNLEIVRLDAVDEFEISRECSL